VRRWLRRKDPHEEWRPPAERDAAGTQRGGPSVAPDPGSPFAWPRPRPPGRRHDDPQWRPDFDEAAAAREAAQRAPSPYAKTPEAQLLPPVKEPILAGENLIRTYPGRVGVAALRGVSVDIRPGEFLALMGPSGSGKSTLLGLLAGLDRPEEGRVLWHGAPIDQLPPAEALNLRRKDLGMVFQNFGLLPTLSALENVELPLRVAGARQDRAREAAVKWLTRLGLEDRLDNRTFELSAGQQQRVAVARALVIEPQVVLADEPIAEVDTENADLILDALGEVVRRGGAVLAATHNPEVLAYSGRIVLLRDGRIEGEGTPEEIASRLSTD
jgi:putative ABC transport system ATP-binding protein